jgi:hypothetical protein
MSRIADELYRRLNEAADELAEELGRPVSMVEALRRLVESMGLEPSDFAWSTRVTEMKDVQNRGTGPR